MTGPQSDWLRKHKPYAPIGRAPGGHVYARRGILHEDGTFELDAPGKQRRITQGCFEVGVLEQSADLARR
jgi:hypothetical protein